MEDKEFILESARNLKRWEATPRRLAEDYADMTRDELIKLIIYQRESANAWKSRMPPVRKATGAYPN